MCVVQLQFTAWLKDENYCTLLSRAPTPRPIYYYRWIVCCMIIINNIYCYCIIKQVQTFCYGFVKLYNILHKAVYLQVTTYLPINSAHMQHRWDQCTYAIFSMIYRRSIYTWGNFNIVHYNALYCCCVIVNWTLLRDTQAKKA